MARSELIRAQTKVEQTTEQNKRIAHKLDRIKGEYDALKKQMRTVEVKYDANATALKQARRAIDKLTGLSDRLRMERQAFIRKTSEAMAKFQAMTAEANNLNRKMEFNTKETESLKKEIEGLKSREGDYKREIKTYQQNLNELSEQLKKLKKAS